MNKETILKVTKQERHYSALKLLRRLCLKAEGYKCLWERCSEKYEKLYNCESYSNLFGEYDSCSPQKILETLNEKTERLFDKVLNESLELLAPAAKDTLIATIHSTYEDKGKDTTVAQQLLKDVDDPESELPDIAELAADMIYNAINSRSQLEDDMFRALKHNITLKGGIEKNKEQAVKGQVLLYDNLVKEHERFNGGRRISTVYSPDAFKVHKFMVDLYKYINVVLYGAQPSLSVLTTGQEIRASNIYNEWNKIVSENNYRTGAEKVINKWHDLGQGMSFKCFKNKKVILKFNEKGQAHEFLEPFVAEQDELRKMIWSTKFSRKYENKEAIAQE